MILKTRGTPLMHGWLTDAIRAGTKIATTVTGGSGAPTINVNSGGTAQSPPWLLPVLLAGGGLMAFAFLKKS